MVTTFFCLSEPSTMENMGKHECMESMKVFSIWKKEGFHTHGGGGGGGGGGRPTNPDVFLMLRQTNNLFSCLTVCFP